MPLDHATLKRRRESFKVGDFVWVDTNTSDYDNPEPYDSQNGYFGWITQIKPGVNRYDTPIEGNFVYYVRHYNRQSETRFRGYTERCLIYSLYPACMTFVGPVALHPEDDQPWFIW